MKFLPGTEVVEDFFKRYGTAFTVIVLYQGLFGGLSMEHKPKRLEKMSNNVLFKLLTMFTIAFTATKDVEKSIISMGVFIIMINLMRTPEERKKAGITII